MGLWFLACTSARGLQGTNLKKLLRTVEALADLGPELTADRDFRQTARTMLTAVMEAAGGRRGPLFFFCGRASLPASGASPGVSAPAGTPPGPPPPPPRSTPTPAPRA